MAKNKKSALQLAASKKLAGLGPKPPSPEHVAHMMLHAEERGEVARVGLEDGTWGWAMTGKDGQQQVMRPTQEMLDALARFDREGHPTH